MPLTTSPTNALTYAVLGTIELTGAEISAYDAHSQRLFTTSGDGLQVIDLANPSNPLLLTTIDLSSGSFGFGNDITSVAVHDGLVAVSVAAPNRTDPGMVFLLDSDGNFLAQFEVGSLPDMLTFTPDGSRLLVANEGEATTLDALDEGATYVNPVGSIGVIDLGGGIGSATVQTAGFEAFNADAATLIADGVRLFVNAPGFAGTTVAQDLEPEYIAIAPDGLSAVVTLQEANAIALLDLSGATPVVSAIVPLGLKDWNGLPFDGSDRDGINFQTAQPVLGMYMPDAVASFTGADGDTYYILANEGDDREDFIDPSDAGRLSTLILDPSLSPSGIGRLNVSTLETLDGDTDGDGDSDQIMAYGARSFSIVNSAGEAVFESGSQIDQFIAQYFPSLFDDSRSDNKGSEPEGVTTAVIDGRTYAFVGLERFDGTMVYDVTDPQAPTFTTFLFNEGDTEPENGVFIAAADSPTGEALYVVSNEDSGTLTVYALTTPSTVGGNGAERLVGTILGEDMTGGNGADLLIANAGNDEVRGGNGDDRLFGGPGNDDLFGENGADVLIGGSGDDLLDGGRGGDLFVFDNSAATGSDRIVRLESSDRLLTTVALDDGDGDDVIDLGAGATLDLFGSSSVAIGGGVDSLRFDGIVTIDAVDYYAYAAQTVADQTLAAQARQGWSDKAYDIF